MDLMICRREFSPGPIPLIVSVAALAVLLVPAAACGGGGSSSDLDPLPVASSWRVEPIASPAGPGSAQPGLAAGPDGIWMSWIESRSEGMRSLVLSRWNGAAWSDPVTVISNERLVANWADTPGLLPMSDGSLVAHWLEEGTRIGSLDVKVSRSTDGGASWSAPSTPHRDGTPSEHGFVSLVERGRGSFGVVWLDGRRMGGGQGEGEGVAGETMLMFSEWSDAGFGPEIQLDERACDCCRTAAVRTAEGMFVAYRDRSPEEIRDISLVREDGAGWNWPTALHDDGWRIDGCPVDGPAVGADEGRIAVAWSTEGGEEGRRVLLALSRDGGAGFAEPVRLDGGRAMGRVDAVAMAGGPVIASWMESEDDEEGVARIVGRAVDDTGVAQAPFRIASTSTARAAGFPRLAAGRDGVLVAWTETGEPSRVRVARIVGR